MSIESNNVLLKFIFPVSVLNEATRKFFISYTDLLVRQTWNLEPFCSSAYIWIHLSLSSKIQRNYMGLRIIGCMGVRANSGQKDPKKPNCHFWRAWSKRRGFGAKQVCCACPLHSTSPKEWAKHLSHPLNSMPGHTPALTLCKELVHSHPWQASKRTCLFSVHLAAARALIKPCLNS